MIINSKRLTLRPIGPEYLLSTHAYASDPENTRFMMYLPNENLEETLYFLTCAEAEWKKPKMAFYEFAVLLGNDHIGAMGVYLRSEDSVEFGWILHKNYWGHGYAEEAARALLQWLPSLLKLKHVVAHCDAENISSARLMEKLGMSLVSRSPGRKNKSSAVESEELYYEMQFT